jgi:hypothetical protein
VFFSSLLFSSLLFETLRERDAARSLLPRSRKRPGGKWYEMLREGQKSKVGHNFLDFLDTLKGLVLISYLKFRIEKISFA